MSICNCGNDTYDVDGVCAMCRMKNRLKTPETEGKKEDGDMAEEKKRVTKQCVACGLHARSNVQPVCDCGVPFDKKAKAVKLPKPIVTLKESKKIHVIATRGQPNHFFDEATDNHRLTVDFSKHTEIYDRIVELADEHIRTPEGQLLFMFREEFQKAKADE